MKLDWSLIIMTAVATVALVWGAHKSKMERDRECAAAKVTFDRLSQTNPPSRSGVAARDRHFRFLEENCDLK